MCLQVLPYIKLLLKINWSVYCFLNTSFTFFLPSWFCSNPSPSVFSLLYYLSWRCSLKALFQEAFPNHLPTNRSTHIHTHVEHPFPRTPLASVVWITIWPLLHNGLYPLQYAYIYSIFPRSRIMSTIYFYPQKLELKSTQILLLTMAMRW